MDNNLVFNACIFDFDGILVNSELILVKFWIKAAGEYGYSLHEADFNSCLGRTREDIKQIQIDQFGKIYPFEDIYKKVQEYFHQSIEEDGLPLIDGVLLLQQYLEERGIKMAVASSTYRAEVLHRMEKAGITGLFPLILGGDEIVNPKPAPDIFLKAAEYLAAEPSECLVLEDSENGVLAARRAGMHVFVIPNLGPVTDLMREMADGIFPSHHELLEYLKTQVFC